MTTINDRTLDENLKVVHRDLTRTQASELKSSEGKAVDRMINVQQTLAVMIEQVKKELPRNDDRKNLVRGLTLMHNETASIVDLVGEEELAKAQATEFLEKNQRRILKVNTLISSLRKQAGEKALKGETAADYAAPSILELIDKSGQIIKDYQHFRQLLPMSNKETKKSFLIVSVPLLAKLDPYVSPQDFQKANIKVGSIGGYPVLEEQLVLGLNTAKLREEKKDIAKYREAVIKIIEQRLNQRFTVMSKMNIGLGNTGFSFTWLMPERTLTKVQRATHKTFAVQEWGFAFKDKH